ncbi:MAG: hypothetical protein ACOCWC_04840 [Bacteroidota bacterium]
MMLLDIWSIITTVLLIIGVIIIIVLVVAMIKIIWEWLKPFMDKP